MKADLILLSVIALLTGFAAAEEERCWTRGLCRSSNVISLSAESRKACWRSLQADDEAQWLTFDTVSNLCILSSDCDEEENSGVTCESCRVANKDCKAATVDGKVLLATGSKLDEAQFEIVDLVNPEKSCIVADYELNLEGAFGGLLGGEPTICGGFDPVEFKESKRCFRYSAACDDWVDMSNKMIQPRSYGAWAPVHNDLAPFDVEDDWLILGDRDGMSTEYYTSKANFGPKNNS